MLSHVDLVSIGALGPANGNSDDDPVYPLGISADGRDIAFDSRASNLVPADTNGYHDVFLKDVQTGAIVRASTDSSGGQVQNLMYWPSISADGRYVAFLGGDPALTGWNPDRSTDVILKNLQTGHTTNVSADVSGNTANDSSDSMVVTADGRFVVFESIATNLVPGDTNGAPDIFVKDLQAGAIARADTDASGNQTTGASIVILAASGDARYVAFRSSDSNLVPGDTNGLPDIFVKDMRTGTVVRANTDSSGNQANGNCQAVAISADGRYVAFTSNATNLVTGGSNNGYNVFLKDVQTGLTTRVSTNANGNGAARTPRTSRSAATGATSRIPATQAALCPATRTGPMISSCTIARRDERPA